MIQKNENRKSNDPVSPSNQVNPSIQANSSNQAGVNPMRGNAPEHGPARENTPNRNPVRAREHFSRHNNPNQGSYTRNNGRIRAEETVDDIKADILRLEKEIDLEIKEIKSMRLGL